LELDVLDSGFADSRAGGLGGKLGWLRD